MGCVKLLHQNVLYKPAEISGCATTKAVVVNC